MSENTATNNTGTEIQGESLTPVQQEAVQRGWVPKEEFDGDPDRWVDAGEFLRRGELFEKIESQSKEMKKLRQAMGELAKHNSKIREVEYKRALDDLKSQKKEALAEADADRVIEIDDQIDLVKEQQRQFQSQQIQDAAPTEIHPELRNWINKNPWYDNNRAMRGWADARGVELAEQGKSPIEVLNTLEKEVKDRFKEKFHNPNRDKPGAVEGNAPRGRTSEPEMELSDVEKTIMKTLVDGGHITKEEYLKQLKAVKGD